MWKKKKKDPSMNMVKCEHVKRATTTTTKKLKKNESTFDNNRNFIH